MVRALRRLLPVAAVALLATPALAQDAAGLTLRASRRDTVRAGSTVTAAFMVGSTRADSLLARLRVELPAEWVALTAVDSVIVPPASAEMLIVSVAVPARTLAGTYAIRVHATTTDGTQATDSVSVLVPPRRATEIALLDRPGYVISGRFYESGFQVRNRGNLPATLRLAVRSSVGAPSLSDTLLLLGPNEARDVRARVRTPADMHAAADDVVEILVASVDEPTLDATRSSSRVTVVPEPSRAIDHYLRVPARANLRASTGQGVAPFELFGRGLVRDGGDATLDFMVRGPTGKASAFGERDEYRVELRAPAWRVRAGDQLFSLSSLTAAGQPGFGAGADGDYGNLSFGGYVQQFRRTAERDAEVGAFLSARPLSGTSVGLNYVERSGTVTGGQVASASASAQRFGIATEVELARSASGAGAGMARTARMSGQVAEVLTLDAGHQFADTGFAGSQRGAEHNYLSGSTITFGFVSFGVNASQHRSDLSRTTGVPYVERFRTASLSATLLDRYLVEAGRVGRETVISGARDPGEQWMLRGRADHELPFVTVSLEAEGGRARHGSAPRRFAEVGASLRRGFAWGQGSVYAQHYSGGGLTKGLGGAQTFGGDASVRVRSSTSVTLIGYATRRAAPRSEWHSQLDALVSRALRTGGIVSLRARMMGGGSRSASQQSVLYLEYGMPFRIPVSPLRTPGRVTGRVVDAVSGRGVSGALVRLGPQVAITDRAGEVSFGDVPGGQHRLSMSQETSFADAVFVGDPTLVVDSTRVTPTRFALSIARSARLDVDVRRFVQARTAVAGVADSLTEAGMVSSATLVLASERDTLYRTTGENGRAVFTDIPPGTWALSVRGDLPAFTRFDPDRVEVTLAPGETKAVGFRLIPRRREVQIIGDSQELRSTAADPKVGTPAASGTRAVKPDEKRPDRQ